jgi:hypothetical protein
MEERSLFLIPNFIRACYRTVAYYSVLRYIGFNRTGNPIEVFYNPIGDDAIRIFHAMDCRDGITAQIEP